MDKGQDGLKCLQLTGAGWGGCIVALVPDDKVEDYINGLKSEYYSKIHKDSSNIDGLIFATQPGSGAQIFRLRLCLTVGHDFTKIFSLLMVVVGHRRLLRSGVSCR